MPFKIEIEVDIRAYFKLLCKTIWAHLPICKGRKPFKHWKYWENYSPPFYAFLSVALRSWAFIEEVSGFKFQKPNMWIILQYNILLQEEANVLSKVSNSMVESCVIRRQVIYWKNVSLSYLTSFIKPNIIGNYQFTLILFHTTFYMTVFKSQLIVTASCIKVGHIKISMTHFTSSQKGT